MRLLIPFLLLAACADDPAPSPVDAGASPMLWTCHTHATCDGVTTDATREFCATPSPDDIGFAGAAAAEDWARTWKVDCLATQGTDASRGLCLQIRLGDAEPGAPATFGCAVECEPTYYGC